MDRRPANGGAPQGQQSAHGIAHRVGKAESLFAANLKPFFDSIGPSATWPSRSPMSGV